MATTTALAHPTPVSSNNADSSTSPDIQSPTPDLQALQGAYIGNIERLEEHAERMSEHGSDLGEEIRKLHNEQKLSDSRRSSLLSAASVAEDPIRLVGIRSRGASASSFTNSIVDVNGAARWGGYSPGGYLPSPTGSLHSSTSQPVALQRQRSNSKASRLDQIMRVDEEEESMERIEEHQEHAGSSPLSRRDSASQYEQSLYQQTSHEQAPSVERPRSVSSFTREYNDIANELQEEFRKSVLLADGYEQQLQEQEQRDAHYDRHGLPDRPPTAASTDTTHKLGTLWQDFDGTHCPDTVPEEEPPSTQGNGSRDSSLLKSAPVQPPQGAPPPDDGMLYYPAPVPRMLNLPQRLSKVPNAGVQAKRRTQILESIQNDNRKSAPWLSDMEPESSSPKAARKSRNLANLPPSLRASAFFDAPAPVQQYEVKGESARDTLDNILEASAHAPVSAFTDHPYGGYMGDEVYGQEKKKHKKTASTADDLDKIESRKSRSSSNLLDTRRNSNGELLNKLKKRNSSTDLNMLTVRATESRMSLGHEPDHPDPHARGPSVDEHAVHSVDGDREHAADDERASDKGHEEGEEGEEPEEQYFGAPTTLLAELQMRKAQQKTRNLQAATAFPNGMHSTLLQLDAVAEIEKQKRLKKKVNLAWEAQPPQDDDASSDDDVPLGMLYPGRGEGLVNKRLGQSVKHDWDRPLGLMAQREIENNEPLSARRNRLLGGNRPANRNTHFGEFNSPSQAHLAVPRPTTPQPESEEDTGETLAQRIRRIKNEKALDEAIGDVRKSTVSADFTTELMGQFGVQDDEKPKPAASLAPDGEEETLSQRRARLQAEALARGDANPHGSRPPMRGSMSMADVLGAHPIDPNNSARKVSDEQLLSSLPKGSLLHQNAVKQERRRVSRMDVNRRVSSYTLDQPLLGEGVGKVTEDQPIGAKIQAYKDTMAGTGPATPMTAPAMGHTMGNPSMSSINLLGGQQAAQSPMMGMPGYPMMPQQMMGMQMGMIPPQMMGMPGMQYPQMGAMGMPGVRQSAMMPQMGVPGMPMMPGMQPGMGMAPGMGAMMMEPPMDPRQRDQIDRWRSSVMH